MTRGGYQLTNEKRAELYDDVREAIEHGRILARVAEKHGVSREYVRLIKNTILTGNANLNVPIRIIRQRALEKNPPPKKPARVYMYNIHGTTACYDYRKCRCQPCVEANYVRVTTAIKKMRERGRADPSVIPHGTLTGYTNWGCRCEPCTTKHTEKCRLYRMTNRSSKQPRETTPTNRGEHLQ